MKSDRTSIFSKDKNQTSIKPISLNENNLVIIRLWKPKVNGAETSYAVAALSESMGKQSAAVGHLSIEVFNENTGSSYYSHWPDFDLRDKREKDPQQQNQMDNRDVGVNRDLEYDIHNENGLPDDYVILYGLDTNKINDVANKIGETCPWTIKGAKSDKIYGNKYASVSYSCSSFVYELLENGGLFEYLIPNHQLSKYAKKSPIDVAQLAKKASEVEQRVYPQTKYFLKRSKSIKSKIPVVIQDKLKPSEIDYATLYYKNNPGDSFLLNQICKSLHQFCNDQLVTKMKLSSKLLSHGMKENLDQEIKNLLEKSGASPLTTDSEGKNALYYAVINRNYNCLKSILTLYPDLAKIDISVYDDNGNTKQLSLAEFAKKLGFSEIESLLIKFGAKVPQNISNNSISKSDGLTLYKSLTSIPILPVEIKNKHKKLIFSGGGPAGYAYAGVIAALDEEPSFSYNDVDAVAGTSIGGVAALTLCLRYKPAQAIEVITSLDLKTLKDGGNFIKQSKRLIREHGRFKGKNLEEFIKSIIKGKIATDHPEDVTFKDLKALGFPDLYVVAAMVCKVNGINTLRPFIFSTKDTPLTSVALAVRASASPPGYFASVKMKAIAPGQYIESPDGFEFIDGGLLDNYFIDIFDSYDDRKQKVYDANTLGFTLLDNAQLQDQVPSPTIENVQNKKKISKAVDVAKCIVNGVLFEVERQKFKDPNNLSRTVQVNRLGVKLDDFDIDEGTIAKLYLSGKNAVKKYFSSLRDGLESTLFASNSEIYPNAKAEDREEDVDHDASLDSPSFRS